MTRTTLPSRAELLAFIRERSGKVGTREIARAFGAKNADRAALKRMLRELADEGHIDVAANGCTTPAPCPRSCSPTSPAATPTASFWHDRPNGTNEAHGAAPEIRVITPRRARPGEAAGVGDRALIRIERTGEAGNARGRVIKLIDRAKHRVLGIFRGLPSGGGRLVPVDKKQLGRELAIPAGATRRRADGDLVAVEVVAPPRFGLPTGRGRSGSARSRASAPSA